MKSPRFILFKTGLPILLAVLLIACNGSNSREQEEIEKKNVFFSADKIHDGWYFAAGDHIVIEGIINGDAYIAGRLIEIDGTINGDLLVAGRKLNINGIISDDVRTASESIRFSFRC